MASKDHTIPQLKLILCGTEIDKGVILREIALDALDDLSKKLLREASAYISTKRPSFWKRAQMSVVGPAIHLVFESGDGSNVVRVTANENREIGIQCTQRLIQCGTEIDKGVILREIGNHTLDDLSQRLLREASAYISTKEPSFWKRAQMSVVGPAIHLVFESSDGSNVVRVTANENREIRTQCTKRLILCGTEIDNDVILREIGNHALDDLSQRLLRKASAYISTKEPSFWTRAQISVVGPAIHLVFESGDGSNVVQVTANEKREIGIQCTKRVIHCGTEIDEGVILREIRNSTLDDLSQRLLREASAYISEKEASFWKRAQMSVVGPAIHLVFESGDGSNVVRVTANENREIEIQCTKRDGWYKRSMNWLSSIART